MTRTLFVIACAVLATACNDFARISQLSPLAPTLVATVPPPPVATAPPPSVFQEPYTQLIVGSTFQRKVDRSANPDCIGVPGFGCQYFRITPERDGQLDVEVKWVLETQPNQALDLTLESATTQVWADFPPPMATAFLTGRVKAGETSQITVWYTFPGLEFTLRTALHPN